MMARPAAWLIAFGLVLGTVLTAWLVLPVATSGARLSVNYWVHEGLTRKLEAATTRERTVLLLGGSSVHFGLSARRLEQHHGLPAVNIGQHAALGRPYILEYGARVVGPGDLVVLILEYNLLGADTASATRNYYVLAHDIGYLYSRPPVMLLKFVAGVAASEWARLLVAQLSPTRPWSAPAGGYRPETIDGWGDETGNERPVSNRPPALDDALGRPFRLANEAIDDLAAFRARVVGAGAQLAVAFPGVLRRHFAADRNAAFFAAVVARLAAERFVVVGTPAAAVFDADCLYDYAYHPLRACTDVRTDLLAADLRAAGLGLEP
jgi:hypothetical protein